MGTLTSSWLAIKGPEFRHFGANEEEERSTSGSSVQLYFSPERRGSICWPTYSGDLPNTSLHILFLLRTSTITLLSWSSKSLPNSNLLEVPSHLSCFKEMLNVQ